MILMTETTEKSKLSDILEERLSKAEFSSIVMGLAVRIREIRDNGVDLNRLLMDPEYIYVDADGTINFIELPIQNEEPFDFKFFMKLCFANTCVSTEEDPAYFGQWMNRLNSEEAMTPQDAIAMSEGWMEEIRIDAEERPLNPTDETAGDVTTEFKQEVLCDVENDTEHRAGQKDVPAAEAEATAIPESEPEPVETEETELMPMATLVRIRTGERRELPKGDYTIGKQRETVDWFIDNTAVSRRHATIEFDVDTYYLTDNNSTNHTYINGVALAAMATKPLRDGDEIMLGNEKFHFYFS